MKICSWEWSPQATHVNNIKYIMPINKNRNKDVIQSRHTHPISEKTGHEFIIVDRH